jgi:hypothetical protein
MASNQKHHWTKEEIKFIRRNWKKMTNPELAKSLGLTLTLLRTKLYELGYKRIELAYWTKEQIAFLKSKYRKIGDVELAIIFESRWPKNKKWTQKHIEKKRKYLKLNRTKKEIEAIHKRNVDRGAFKLCALKRWLTTGQAKEGEVRMWNGSNGIKIPMIKIEGEFVQWARWKWEKHRGPIKKGMNVVFKNGNARKLSNLVLMTDAQLCKQNSLLSSKGLSDNYIAGIMAKKDKQLKKAILENKSLIELKRTSLILNRTINAKQQNQTKA